MVFKRHPEHACNNPLRFRKGIEESFHLACGRAVSFPWWPSSWDGLSLVVCFHSIPKSVAGGVKDANPVLLERQHLAILGQEGRVERFAFCRERHNAFNQCRTGFFGRRLDALYKPRHECVASGLFMGISFPWSNNLAEHYVLWLCSGKKHGLSQVRVGCVMVCP